MASLLGNGRLPRDILPPINHPDFDRSRLEKSDHLPFSTTPNLSITTAPVGSPHNLYSGPPPPYSCAPSTTESGLGLSGYFSPPLSATRRSTKDEKDLSSAKTLPSLPSLHEALGGDKSVAFSGPPSATTYSHGPGSVTATAAAPNFSDVPRGPPNPFSHTTPHQSLLATLSQSEPTATHTATTHPISEPPSHVSQPYSSPLSANKRAHRSSGGSFSSINRPFEHVSNSNNNNNNINNSPYLSEQASQNPPFRDYPPPAPPPQPPTLFNFEPVSKFDDSRNPFVTSNPSIPYGETVKRHLEGFDAELSLNEITETAGRTYEFARSWSQRHHANNRGSMIVESAPSLPEIDEMMRQQHRTLENINRLREVVMMQQTTLSEQRARVARGHLDDEYHASHDEYKNGGFAGGDAKKRRGKAAPPGRCHSCNRAETPEWRRGPDGARTLCNACGLHYAKLTRKLGVNKASALTGSNLRPKGLDPRPAHV